MRHQWQRIEYEDDVVPWHCKVCRTWDTQKWDEPCPGDIFPNQKEPPKEAA